MLSISPPAWPTDPDLLAVLRLAVTTGYVALLAVVCVYGLHRYWLVHQYRRHLRDRVRPAGRFQQLPRVTVQLPMYNEAAVARRVIDAAARLDYPRDRLQIQVVDDSTDDGARVAAARVRHWQQQGLDIVHLHRDRRIGFKAGALADATATATGAFIAIFDADFVPPRRFLKRTIHHFTDPQIGMVQARWGHLNRDDALLTRCQGIYLDAHFLIEHAARNRSGALMHFNGTAGIWRREAIDDGGGWQHDTLTEDMDLSYRSQLAGWRFRFLPQVVCPAELPPEMTAFKSQQHRWTKGSIQCAIKLLPRILRAKLPLRAKVEATFHLTCPMVYLCMTALVLLLYPALLLNMQLVDRGSGWGLLLGLLLLMAGTVSATVYYAASQKRQRRSVLGVIALTPMLMALGIGIALSNAVACLEALAGHRSAFVRTPKYGRSGRPQPAPLPSRQSVLGLIELAIGLYMLCCAALAVKLDATFVGSPFLLLFAAGYFYVGGLTLRGQWRARLPLRRRQRATVPG
jgi:cellulose synthase/poly-beta-1,6-N-acetylglucosamine synthase-like glycosyltransferase